MKLSTKNLAPPTSQEVAEAKQFLSHLGFLSKTMISLNEDYKHKLTAVLIGENDKDKIIPIAQQIQNKIIAYYEVPIEVNTSGKHVSPETETKNALCAELIQLNKALNTALDTDIYAPYTSKFNAVSAFYPSPTFVTADLSQTITIAKPAPKQFSAAFAQDKITPYYNIAVTPPSSTVAYSYIAETFPSVEFLTHCLKSNSVSTWSKYNNGRSHPMPVAWGLFLLAAGLHPIYQLKPRENTEAFAENALFQDLYPQWKETFNAQQWKGLKRYDLQPFEINVPITHKKIDVAQYRSELMTSLQDWYKAGKSIRHFKSAEEVYKYLETLSDPETLTADKQKEIIDLLLEMTKNSVFRQTFTRWIIAAFSEQYTFSDGLDDKIYDQTSVASLLHLEANPSPNIYVMIRSLFTDDVNFAETITHASGVSRETWSRYEQGTRIPHNIAWTSIILALDMHPIYRLVKRPDSKNTKEVFEIYQELHQTLDQPRAIYRVKGDKSSVYYSEFYPEPKLSYEQFCKEYLK